MEKSTRLERARRRSAQLQAPDTAVTPLLKQADELAQKEQLESAVRLCWSALDVAHRNNDDDYMYGATRFHMALAYFAAGKEPDEDRATGKEADWDRAAELCGQAAQHFEKQNVQREQGVALMARTDILEALCDAGHDRWTQMLRAAAEGYALVRHVSEPLGAEALERYGELGRKYALNGMAAEKAAAEAATAAASAPGIESSEEPAATASSVPPTAAPSPATRGLRSPRAYTGARFGAWEFFALVGMGGVATFGVILACVGLNYLLTNDARLGYIFGAAVLTSLAAILLVVAALVWTSQITFTLHENQVAVIIEGGRVWAYPEPRRYWLRVLRQDLAAIIPTQPRKYEKFIPDAAILKDGVLNAFVCAKYRVSAADLFWDRVLSGYPRAQWLGIPALLPLSIVEGELDKHAEALLQSTVIKLTNDPEVRKLGADEHLFHTQVMQVLSNEAAKDGITFEGATFRVMANFHHNGTH